MTKLNKKNSLYHSQADKDKKTALIAKELKVSQRRVQQIYRPAPLPLELIKLNKITAQNRLSKSKNRAKSLFIPKIGILYYLITAQNKDLNTIKSA